jgi:hypothetical protein
MQYKDIGVMKIGPVLKDHRTLNKKESPLQGADFRRWFFTTWKKVRCIE